MGRTTMAQLVARMDAQDQKMEALKAENKQLKSQAKSSQSEPKLNTDRYDFTFKVGKNLIGGLFYIQGDELEVHVQIADVSSKTMCVRAPFRSVVFINSPWRALSAYAFTVFSSDKFQKKWKEVAKNRVYNSYHSTTEWGAQGTFYISNKIDKNQEAKLS